MTTEIDPVRFTDSSTDAPELLRGAFAAGAKEGPSPAQMRMLAVKLAAVAAGTAVVASASAVQASAQASTTLGGGAVATTSALPLAKIVVAVAMVGASALGGVALMSKSEPARVRAPNAQVAKSSVREQVAAPVEVAPTFAPTTTNEVAAPSTADTGDSIGAARRTSGEIDAPAAQVVADTKAVGAERPTSAQRRAVITKVKPAAIAKGAAVAQEAHEQASKADVPSEVELLRRARTALASRPREAFALTEQHREHYPRGVFAQERDALAIEALLRAGDTDTARGLAQRFVSAHPSSPHAHRFRETLGLR